MVNLKIDNIVIEVEDGTTILDAAGLAGIPIPSLCYLKGINEIGACRVCVVEVKGKDNHHIAESAFKALGRCLRQSLKSSTDLSIPSSKGSL